MVEIGCFDQGRRLRRQARGQARAHHENLAMGAGRPFDRPATGLEQGQVVSAGRIRRQAGAIVGGPAGQNFLKGEIGLVFLGARQVVLVLAGLNACARILEVTEREIAETELIKDHRPLKRLALEIFDVLAGEIRACQFRRRVVGVDGFDGLSGVLQLRLSQARSARFESQETNPAMVQHRVAWALAQ